ncbi:MAG: gluconate 2-dehydrogenase subunit 3 family protein [Acetobacteraceae bacterium]|nr:gluconate 2-dehydrogenase subunit 3 family protein [Acetobacteraceae bacterium]
MREIERRTTVGRRVFMRGAATAVPAAALASAGMGITAEAAWAQAAKALQPGSMATLVRMSRDTYPHDHIPDVYYVRAVSTFDDKASSDADLKKLLEDGVARLDGDAKTHFKTSYLEVPAEADRISLLTAIAQTPFFSKIRSGLVVSLYNQPDIWKRFGYEGSSYEYGGYLNRGFNDIDWLPAV